MPFYLLIRIINQIQFWAQTANAMLADSVKNGTETQEDVTIHHSDDNEGNERLLQDARKLYDDIMSDKVHLTSVKEYQSLQQKSD